MPVIHYHAPLRALVAVRGHPFDRSAFDAMFQAMDGISATMVDQPAAALLMNPDGMRDFDLLVLYDMPGLDFDAVPRPGIVTPSPALQSGFRALLEQGKGVVALHHALAGWPDWSDYHDWLGGQFLYRPATVHGSPCLDSGYRHDVAYTATTCAHPVTAGVAHRFPLTDELYLAEVFEDRVEPLLTTDASTQPGNYWSAAHAMEGRMFANDGWNHVPGSRLIGWTKMAINSRLVYLQPGDGPSAYDNPDYRRLLENALRWVAKPAA
ncbi:ThuA domain-containing protein [Sphingomonas sp. RB3P16]|uniref:ThuA domain-containing protein n=1 Tax=Parasphingomonas frigoris TaxID=3096163 RepID=UPI002FCA0400